MAQFFLDSSALVKRFVQEVGTPFVLGLVKSEANIIVSRLTHVEVVSAMVRRAKTRDIEKNVLEDFFDAVESEFSTRYEIVELGGAVVAQSVALTREHGLRAADSIQLASAVTAATTLPLVGNLSFVSSDVELNAAAEAAGLQVVDPSVT